MVIVPLSDGVSEHGAHENSIENSNPSSPLSENLVNEFPNLSGSADTSNDDTASTDPHLSCSMEVVTNQKRLLGSPYITSSQDNREGKTNDNPTTPGNICDQSKSSPCSLEVSFSVPDGASYFDNILESQSKERSTLAADKENFEPSPNISANEEKIDDYVRSGTHFRSLLDYAFSKISNGVSQKQFEPSDMSICAVHHHDRSDSEICRKRNTVEGEICLRQDDIRPLRRRRLDLMIDNTNENEGRYGAFDIPNEGSGKKHASELAREKMAEILKLKRALKEAEEHAEAMTQVNITLREASASISAKMTRTTEALRIAGQNAANARADADAAEARAASLTSQINSMTSILDETKRTYTSIRKEHDEISAASRSLEGQLMQTESELNRLQKEKFLGDEECNALRENVEHISMDGKKTQIDLDEKNAEVSSLRRKLLERDDVDKARVERTNRIEIELRESKKMLVDATSAATEAESTIGVLQETIKELRRENKTHHDRISEIFETSGKEKERLQKSISEAESEAQKLRIKISFDEEELQRLNLDQSTKDKEISQLKNRLSSLEKRLIDVGSSGPTDITTTSPISRLNIMSPTINNNNYDEKGGSKEDFVIPPLPSSSKKIRNISNTIEEKENRPINNHRPPLSIRRKSLGTPSLKSIKCCICFKPAHGIMKSCQCGRVICDKRAHASCITSKNPLPSVSHPGTPAPLLPCILCKTSNRNSF